MPTPYVNSCDFSFSGLKTKALRAAQAPDAKVEDVIAGVQQAVVDHLVTRCQRYACTPRLCSSQVILQYC